ncbi:uncharacterized protein PHACADRAFT_23641 [Phanerochaete carnosa HHB-10118-sp]|uniref:DUF4218 domain-containing protein n=1 Tax=Phanerochaete carnosa (strain HHB-10118-sp) TaxID=650164 RepID=K5WLA9_PHACS|nr:uncharacterized protein PHACADRAFT_23641 [Phanerochaete carnosa HHB-10118-sp]EKM60215.1 hypothetical protein PHACADRAFT_23641 [Phanerochaete carnosa HHB-10118-sp]
MALVSAVMVAEMHHMTPRRRMAYVEYIRQYVSKLHTLFPHVRPRPNKHVAFHIFDFLLLYGPIQSWWCFPFERLVGVLQNLPSNHKFGQMEGSLMKSFIATSKLRRWLNRADALPVIKECKVVFNKAFRNKFKESALFEDVTASRRTPVVTPPDLFSLIQKARVVLRVHTPHTNTMYSHSSTHLSNSLILYRAGGDASRPQSAGSIKYIYDDDSIVTLAVQRQLAALPGTADPFSPYPDYDAQLHSTRLDDDLEEVQLHWVIGHYARWPMSEDVCVVLPLLRKCNDQD